MPPAPPRLSLIAAVPRNRAIGCGNQLVWTEPMDQAHFRRTTLGSPVLMGRKTWDSLPTRFRPLPGRRNLVLSRDAKRVLPGAEVVSSLDDALHRAAGCDRLFVIGGAELYTLALPLTDELLLTEIDAHLPGDVFFPDWHDGGFVEVERQPHVAADGTAFAFVRYLRNDAATAA